MTQSIVSVLRWFNKDMGLKHSDIAHAIGTSQSFISRIIREDREPRKNVKKYLAFIQNVRDHGNNPNYVRQLARAARARKVRYPSFKKRTIHQTKWQELEQGENKRLTNIHVTATTELPNKYFNNQYLIIALGVLIVALVFVSFFVR